MKPDRINSGLRNRVYGSSMIEVLVTLVILMIGLLGLAGLQMKTQANEMESYQRTQAMVILNDIVSRFQTNRANPADYLAAGTVGGGTVVACTGLVGAPLDLCEWGNALRGAGETSGATKVGAMIGARGCITQIQARNTITCTPGIYEITVTWQGMFATVAPNNTCAQTLNLYGGDTLRRAISLRVAAGTGGCP